jgi:eukaryotic-like serine/threonine-protein kinase
MARILRQGPAAADRRGIGVRFHVVSAAPAALPLEDERPLRVGRYLLAARLASGGMSSVHLGRLVGAAGFGRTVAIKQLHPHLAEEREFVSMLLDEARLASRVRHPNVVSVTDVVQAEGQLLLVMDYVPGVSMAELLRLALDDGRPLPLPIVSAIGCGILHGLHAAHEATDERGRPLGIVHRDVSPQNVLVGSDGVARLVDFGVAKAAGRLHTTVDGQVKGKLAYMAPEQLRSASVDRRADVYAAALVIWEAVTLQRPFGEDSDAPLVRVQNDIPPVDRVRAGVPPALTDLLGRGLQRVAERRIGSAQQMALELAAAVPPAPGTEVAALVAELSEDLLRKRAALVARVEQGADLPPAPVAAPAPRRNRWIAPVIALVAIAGAAALGVWRWNERSLALPPDRGAASSPRPSPPRAEVERLPVEPTPPPVVPAPAPAAARPTRRAPASGKSDHCTPPFTVDAAGHRRYKVECL